MKLNMAASTAHSRQVQIQVQVPVPSTTTRTRRLEGYDAIGYKDACVMYTLKVADIASLIYGTEPQQNKTSGQSNLTKGRIAAAQRTVQSHSPGGANVHLI